MPTWPGFTSVVQSQTKGLAKKASVNHTLKVIVASINHVDGDKPSFNKRDLVYISISESTATLPHVLSAVCDQLGEEYIMYMYTCLPKVKSDAQKPLSTIDDNILVVKMPPKMKKQGRSKGAGLTVIGLPKKKGKTTSGPTASLLKSEWEKTRGICATSTTSQAGTVVDVIPQHPLQPKLKSIMDELQRTWNEVKKLQDEQKRMNATLVVGNVKGGDALNAQKLQKAVKFAKKKLTKLRSEE
eukprot:Em0001g2226a